MTQTIWKIALLMLLPIMFMAGCKDDEIPSALSGPFLVSDLVIEQKPSPSTDSTLSIGQPVTFSVDIAYTLSASDAKNLNSLTLAYGLRAVNTTLDTVYGSLGAMYPIQFVPLTSSSKVVSVSTQLTLPNPGFHYVVDFIAFIQVGDTTTINPLMSQSGREIQGNTFWDTR